MDILDGLPPPPNPPTITTKKQSQIIRSFSNENSGSYKFSSKTPPLTPSKKKNCKLVNIKIILLDETVTLIQVQVKTIGRFIFDQMCKQLNILECDYFGLEYADSGGTNHYIDLEKKLNHQVGLNVNDPVLKFVVKFYTPDPLQLEEEFTRYLFSLQIRRDLATGLLQCNDNTAALMASYLVQAECGDFNEEDYPDPSYLNKHLFVPNQDYEIENRIRENHKKHVGQSPAEADLHLLEVARRTEFYGIKLHPAKDEDGVVLNLTVSHMGILIFQGNTKINIFSWSKIRKISFKRKRFLLKLHPEGYGYYKETIDFIFDGRNECKTFWKRCVEHHSFFRCDKAPIPSTSSRSKGLLNSRGSSFRYSGRTQKQMVSFVRENFIKRSVTPSSMKNASPSLQQRVVPSSFQRSSSFRSSNNADQAQSGVSTSCSSPNMIISSNDRIIEINSSKHDSDSQPEDTISPGTSINSSPQHNVPMYYHHHEGVQFPQQQQDPDWFYYISRELLFTQITFAHDIGFIYDSFVENQSASAGVYENQNNGAATIIANGTSLGSLVSSSSLNLKAESEMLKLISTLKAQSNNLLKQIQSQILDVKKERWEFKHGCNLINLIIKHYTDYQQVYKSYVKKCLEFQDEENYSYYLPIISIKLKPIYRIVYIYEEFIGVLKFNIAFKTKTLLDKSNNIQISNLINKLTHILKPLFTECSRFISYYENKSKFIEFSRELIGFNSCILSNPSIFPVSPPTSPILQSINSNTNTNTANSPSPGPFILQGMLLKVNNTNLLQNRIFFLFRDVLIYGSRISSASGFRIHGFLELYDCQLIADTSNEEELSDIALPPRENSDLSRFNGFKIITRTCKVIFLYALCPEDKEKWLYELRGTLIDAKELNLELHAELLANISIPVQQKPEELKSQESNNNKISYNHRANSIIHVTWHRNITISHKQLCHAMKFNLSNYLLRKFKNSAGWQRLFIIFTNITLFFFKSHEDTTPLASLPLLGYKIEIPNPEASEDLPITKDNVFKLIYKTHVYYFRAESSFTFKRWMYTLERAISIPETRRDPDGATDSPNTYIR